MLVLTLSLSGVHQISLLNRRDSFFISQKLLKSQGYLSHPCSENADFCGVKVVFLTDSNNKQVDMVTSNALNYDALTNTVSKTPQNIEVAGEYTF